MPQVLPAYPYVVLDMNACRDEELVRPLLEAHKQEGIGILLPAVAHWELTKGADMTLPLSFRLLAARPEAVSSARHSYVFKRLERKDRKRLRMRAIVDHGHTRNIRDVLRGFRDDTHYIDPATIAAVRNHWRAVLDHENEPKILRQLVAVHQRECPQPIANRIRAALDRDPPDRGPFNAYLRDAVGGRVALATFLRRVGYGSSMAKRLTRFPSFSLLHLVGLLAVALRWRVYGGASAAMNASEQKLEKRIPRRRVRDTRILRARLRNEGEGGRARHVRGHPLRRVAGMADANLGGRTMGGPFPTHCPIHRAHRAFPVTSGHGGRILLAPRFSEKSREAPPVPAVR
jgi:hypothetical protein